MRAVLVLNVFIEPRHSTTLSRQINPADCHGVLRRQVTQARTRSSTKHYRGDPMRIRPAWALLPRLQISHAAAARPRAQMATPQSEEVLEARMRPTMRP